VTPPDIRTSRGSVSIGPDGRARLEWSTAFWARWKRKYNAVQVFVDSEVLRLCEPYIPLRTGMLIMSGILATRPGQGRVGWIVPYARRQYYMLRKPGTPTGPLRGPYWFERMKTTHKHEILEGARRVARQP